MAACNTLHYVLDVLGQILQQQVQKTRDGLHSSHAGFKIHASMASSFYCAPLDMNFGIASSVGTCRLRGAMQQQEAEGEQAVEEMRDWLGGFSGYLISPEAALQR